MSRTKNKKENRKKKSTRQLINTETITGYSLITFFGEEIVYFMIKPTNISVLSSESLGARVFALMNVLKGLAEFEMMCLDSRESFENNKQHLKDREAEETVPEIRSLLINDIDYLDIIQVQMATAREFLIVIRLRNLKKQEIFPYLGRVEKTIREQGFKTRRADREDIKRVLAVYLEQNVTSEHFEDYDGQRWFEIRRPGSDGKETVETNKVGRTQDEDEMLLQDFLDMIAPSIIKFETDYFLCGNTFRCVWAIREYPTSTTQQAILQHLGEKAGVTLHIYTRLVKPNEERKIMQNAEKKNRMARNSTDDIQTAVTAEANLQDVANIIQSRHRNREPFLHTAVYIELIAQSMDRLGELQTAVMAELNCSKLNVDRLVLRQQQGFLCVMPCGWNALGYQFERVLPASSVANLFPFAYSGKTDPHGFYLGHDKFGSNIIVDFNRRAEDKTNANILILGNSGQGKSYLMKLILCNILESGKNVICLDPEHEERELTYNLGGCFIDLMSGEYIINVLEPKCWDEQRGAGADSRPKVPLSLNGNACDEDGIIPSAFLKASKLSQHISFLRDFFRSYKDFTDAQIDTIELMVEKLYQNFGISDASDLRRMAPTDFPILSDLYDLIEQEYKAFDESKRQLYTSESLREILLGLHSMCRGAEAKFFNGYSNITSSRFLTFGVKGLLNASRNIRNALLFNVLSYMSDKLLTEGNTTAAIDELYLFLSNPVAIEYIRNAMKRVRKKESALVLASQNVEDFALPNIAEYTKPLFSIPTHAFLFNAGNIDAKFYMDSLQLEPSEFELIRFPQRGVCLYKCGNERYNLRVEAPLYKRQLFGTAGGN